MVRSAGRLGVLCSEPCVLDVRDALRCRRLPEHVEHCSSGDQHVASSRRYRLLKRLDEGRLEIPGNGHYLPPGRRQSSSRRAPTSAVREQTDAACPPTTRSAPPRSTVRRSRRLATRSRRRCSTGSPRPPRATTGWHQTAGEMAGAWRGQPRQPPGLRAHRGRSAPDLLSGRRRPAARRRTHWVQNAAVARSRATTHLPEPVTRRHRAGLVTKLVDYTLDKVGSS